MIYSETHSQNVLEPRLELRFANNSSVFCLLDHILVSFSISITYSDKCHEPINSMGREEGPMGDGVSVGTSHIGKSRPILK